MAFVRLVMTYLSELQTTIQLGITTTSSKSHVHPGSQPLLPVILYPYLD